MCWSLPSYCSYLAAFRCDIIIYLKPLLVNDNNNVMFAIVPRRPVVAAAAVVSDFFSRANMT